MKNKTEELVQRINAENLIILEGAISVLGALGSDYAKIVKIIIKSDLDNQNTRRILSSARFDFDMIEYFSRGEFNAFENMINKSGFLYSMGRTHGGIIALAEKRGFLTSEELIAGPNANTLAIIEGIEDPYNLGYAVRALYTQGTDGLILPERDFGFSESVIEKASTGTFYKMPAAVYRVNHRLELIKLLRDGNFRIYCVHHKAPADSQIQVRDIFGVTFADRSVFIIGGEKRGISKDFLNNADEIVKIPYAKDFSHSLAAQTAATVVAYEIHRQRKQNK